MRDRLDIWVRIGLIMLVIVLNIWWPDHEGDPPLVPVEQEDSQVEEINDEEIDSSMNNEGS